MTQSTVAERRSAAHPLRRAKDYQPDGQRTRRWTGPERSIRLGYRKRPLTTVLLTIFIALVVLTFGVGASTFGFARNGDGVRSVTVVGAGRIVTIGPGGFGLNTMTIATGETVSFSNIDVIPHEVRTEAAAEASCDGKDMFIAPGTFRACTFERDGVYAVVATGSPDTGSRISVTVAPANSVLSAVTLTVDHSNVVAGALVTMSGATNLTQPGTQVDLIAKDLRAGTYRKVKQTATDAAGAFAFQVGPRRSTIYFVNAIREMNIVTSTFQTVLVTPAK